MKAARVPVAVAQRPAALPKVACAAVATDKASACPVLSALQPLPGPHISHLEAFFTARRDLDEHRFRTWGGSDIVAGHYVGMLPAAFVAAPDVHREVMSQESAGALRPGWPVSARRLLGEESILVTGDVAKHKVLRKLVAPAVAPEAVEAYLPDIHNICVNTLEQWVDACARGQTVKAMEGVKVMTLRIIASVVMDMQLDEEGVQAVSKDFNTWIRCFIHVAPHDVWPLPFHASMRARDRLVERIEKRLAALQQELASSPAFPNGSSTARHSTLRRLVTEQDEHGNTLSHQQVVDNLLTMLFAGHDTTASQLATLLYELAQHPQVLARVRAEQQQVVARHGPRMTPAALKDMKYTQAVLQEVFRSRPVVSATPRIATRDLGLKGYEVKQGQGVVVSIGIMMEHDPRWPAEGDPASNPLHPANFNPERFMTEEGGKQGQQHPFGAGIRTCVGMALAQAEAKIFLATLARGYTYTADTGATRWKRDPLPRPQNGLPVFVQRLDASAAAVPGSA